MTYTEETATILDLDAPRSNPNAVDFVLNHVPNAVTFTNTGEQQCVILYLEYHYGDVQGVESIATGRPVRTEYFTLTGERVTTPGNGMYVVRITDANGRTTSRKVVF